jgi:hypothetical protein
MCNFKSRVYSCGHYTVTLWTASTSPQKSRRYAAGNIRKRIFRSLFNILLQVCEVLIHTLYRSCISVVSVSRGAIGPPSASQLTVHQLLQPRDL